MTDPRQTTQLVRGGFGGVLMGLANLVPGISGGTMLLVTGVYPAFVDAIAELTTFRFRIRSLLILGIIALAALLTIAMLSGHVKMLVLEHRWIMYSLFIGLTLGGVPVVWALIPRTTPGVWISAAFGVGAMVAMLLVSPASNAGGSSWLMLMLGGAAGATAMVVPGVSGAYLLQVLGQYVPILGAVDRCKDAVKATDLDALIAEFDVVVPVGVGVVLGIVVVSNLIRWLLHRYPSNTLGVVLGLLCGAVLGLWPFQQPVEPMLGTVIKGEIVTEVNLPTIDAEDWPTEIYTPTPVQVASGLGLVGVGFLITLGIGRLGARRPASDPGTGTSKTPDQDADTGE